MSWGWLLGPWPMFCSALLWFFQAIAYAHRGDWGHVLMSVCYGAATFGLIWAWFHPVG